MELLYTLLSLACACALSGALYRPEPFTAQLVCRECKYSREGLQADALCPECGCHATRKITVDPAPLRRSFLPRLVGCFVTLGLLTLAILASREISYALEDAWRLARLPGELNYGAHGGGCRGPSFPLRGPLLPAFLSLAMTPLALCDSLRLTVARVALLFGAGFLLTLIISVLAALT